MPATKTKNELIWKVDGPFEVAADHRRLYVRETVESEVFGAVVMGALTIGMALFGWKLVHATGAGSRIFGGLLLVLATLIAAVALRQVLAGLGLIKWSRTPLLVFDRGDSASMPPAIEYGRKRLLTSTIRCLSTRPSTVGSKHDLKRHILVAELHDGSEVVLTVDQTPDWTAHYANRGARWLGLSYRAFRG